MNTKQVLSILFLAAWVLSPLAHAKAPGVDKRLWKKAVSISESNCGLIPGTITGNEKVSDTKGQLVEVNVTRIKVTQEPDRSLNAQLMERKENGTDRTKAFEKEFADYKKDFLSELTQGSLFRKSNQSNITLTAIELKQDTAVYSFTLTDQGLTFTGQAGIDREKGHAVWAKLAVPLMEEGDMVIKDFQETTRFARQEGRWYPEEITEKMGIQIKGFFSSFKGCVETKSLMSDHFNMEE